MKDGGDPHLWMLRETFGVVAEKRSSKHNGGGLVVFVRKGVEHKLDLKIHEHPDLDAIVINTPDFTFIPAYLPPNAIVGPDLPTKDELWTGYGSLLSEAGPKIITMLDANAKIGTKESGADVLGTQLPERRIPAREGFTEATTDKDGFRLLGLAREFEIAILNDRKGSGGFTRIRKDEQSILDYGLVSVPLYDHVTSFKVGDKLPCSDHCPLELEILIPDRIVSGAPEEPAEKARRPTKPWNQGMTTTSNAFIEERVSMKHLREAGIEAADQATDWLSGIMADAGKAARRKDKSPSVFKQSSDAIYQFERSPDRENLVRELKIARRSAGRTNDPEIRARHIAQADALEGKIKRLKKELKQKAWRENAALLKTLSVEQPREFFRVIKQLQAQQPGIPVPFDARVAFVQMVASAEYVNRVPWDEDILEPQQRRATKVGPGDLLIPFGAKSVQKTLQRKLANGKAADLDGNVPEQIKYASEGMFEVLTWIMNQALAGDPLPGWGVVKLTLLPKKPPRTVIENYRGVSIERAIEKVFSTLWSSRLVPWVEDNELLPEMQFGFRPKRSTEDAILVIQGIARIAKARGTPLILIFVDFTKAFDTVDRGRLWRKLSEMGIPAEVVEMFKHAFGRVSGKLRGDNRGEESPLIDYLTGVKQGDPLSTLFFILFIADLDDFLRLNRGEGFRVDEDAELVIAILAVWFADDTTLVATSQKGGQRLLDLLSAYCSLNGLEVNVPKTTYLATRVPADMELTYRGQKLAREEMVKFLGFYTTLAGGKRAHLEGQRAKATKALGMWMSFCRWQPGIPPTIAMNLFNTFVRAVDQYGSAFVVQMDSEAVTLAGLAGHNGRDETTRMALRNVLGLPKSTPIAAMFLITGRVPLYAHDMEALLRLWMKLPAKPKDVRNIVDVMKRDYESGRDLGNLPAVVHWLLKLIGGEDGDAMWREDRRDWNAKGIQMRVRRQVTEALRADLEGMPRATFFRSSGIEHEPNRVLELRNVQDRRNILRILLSAHPLAVETGRHAGLKLHERTCRWDPDEVEDEQHFLFHCRANEQERDDLRARMAWTEMSWNMETWVWMLSPNMLLGEGGEEEKAKRAVLRLAAAFITQSLARRERGPSPLAGAEPQLDPLMPTLTQMDACEEDDDDEDMENED